MPPKKKKTKAAANPARGFATTSVASKPVTRLETAEENPTAANGKAAATSVPAAPDAKGSGAKPLDPSTAATDDQARGPAATSQKPDLTPEEFEKQLQESELQLLVEKHGQKVKRDAQRQKTRLETDRRLLRSQADTINTRKWLPQELMDHILDLIQAEHRFAASSLGTDTSAGKLPPEEDLTVRLWTLQQALTLAGFAEDKVGAVLRYILEIAPNMGSSAKDSIWGLEEALDWLARECTKDELPAYDQRAKTHAKPGDTPQDSPMPSGANTPRLIEPSGPKGKNGAKSRTSRAPSPRKVNVKCDSDIEPDDLVPVYLESKAKLFQLQRPRQGTKQGKNNKSAANGSARSSSDLSQDEMEEAKLLAKIDRIQQDVLFDKDFADQKWISDRIVLERDYALAKREEAEREEATEKAQSEETAANEESVTEADAAKAEDGSDDDEVAREAKKMAAEILQDEDADDGPSLSDLFASLPVQEVDPSTGKTSNVINGSDGKKVFIRDFGKWTGVSPSRALEEACRSR